jgi:hypothetical protein
MRVNPDHRLTRCPPPAVVRSSTTTTATLRAVQSSGSLPGIIRSMAKASKGGPARMPAEPQALHLTASMRVIRSHLHMRHVSVAAARDEIVAAAMRVEMGSLTPEIELLSARLEKATGCGIAELAQHAEAWPS